MHDPRLEALIAPDAPLTQIGRGFAFTEGPVWVAAEGSLLFSDIPGDARWRWSPARGVELVARPTFKANGMCLDTDGHLIVCEHVSSCVVRIRDGQREVLAFHYDGRYLNSPNDVVARASDGSLYFTDPPYGRDDADVGEVRRHDLDFQGVYRIPPGGGEIALVVARDEFEKPNGLCFSPDESKLYINDTAIGTVKVFDVATDGSLSNARVLHEGIGTGERGTGNVDGMECDETGNVWVTGPGGIWVLTPQGEHLGTVAVPETVASLCWGGADMHTLFLTSSTTVHAVATIVGPARLAPF
jgi:gluconolactonase